MCGCGAWGPDILYAGDVSGREREAAFKQCNRNVAKMTTLGMEVRIRTMGRWGTAETLSRLIRPSNGERGLYITLLYCICNVENGFFFLFPPACHKYLRYATVSSPVTYRTCR